MVTTLVVLIVATIGEFEESYCWEKGEQAEKFKSEMIIATKEDEELLKEYLGGVKEGNKIGASFRAHILCHETYNFNDAIRDILTTFPN